MKTYQTETELVSACLDCEVSAQRELYDRYVQAMYNTVYRYTCDHQDTQDILQEGFTKVFKSLKSFDSEKGQLLSWMRRIHIHCALDFLKRKKMHFEDIDSMASMTTGSNEVYERLDAQYILELIEDLNSRDRVIFNMFHIEGYSHEEIADLLSININSSRVYLARTRKILREKIIAFHGKLLLAR